MFVFSWHSQTWCIYKRSLNPPISSLVNYANWSSFQKSVTARYSLNNVTRNRLNRKIHGISLLLNSPEYSRVLFPYSSTKYSSNSILKPWKICLLWHMANLNFKVWKTCAQLESLPSSRVTRPNLFQVNLHLSVQESMRYS